MKKGFLSIILAAAMTVQSVGAVNVFAAPPSVAAESVSVIESNSAGLSDQIGTVPGNEESSKVVSSMETTILAGEKIDLKAIFFANESVSKFTLADKSQKKIAKVNKKGILTGKKTGEVTINAETASGTLSCKVKVIKPKKNKRLKLKMNQQLDLNDLIGIENDEIMGEWKVQTSKKTPNIVKFKEAGDDGIIIKDNGTARLTGTFGVKGQNGVVKPAKVKLSLKSKGIEPYIDIRIDDNDFYAESYETQSETITIKGDVSAESKATSVSAVIDSYSISANSVSVDGVAEFQIPKAALETGRNNLTITANLEKGGPVSRTIALDRLSKELNTIDSVKEIDVESDIKNIYDSMVDVWADDKDTPDDRSDDEIHIAVSTNSALDRYVRNGKIKKDDVIYIDNNEYFEGGLSLVYLGHDDNYPIEHLQDPDKCEVIITRQAEFADLYDEDICLDYNKIDKPSFIMVPKGTDLAPMSDSFETLSMPDTFSVNAMDPQSSGKSRANDYVRSKGIQTQNFIKIIDPSKIDCSDGFMLNFSEVVVYDKDGDPNGDEDGNGATKTDRITVSGKLGVTDLDPKFGLEWHPVKYAEALPQQIMCKLDYKVQNQLKVEFGGEVASLEDAIKKLSEASGTDALKNSIFGYEITGVDYDKTVVLGAFGFDLATRHPVTGTIKTISGKSKSMKITPMLIVVLCMDLDGNIEAKTTLTYTNETSHTRGINVQKQGFTGKYGSSAENRRLADKIDEVGNYEIDYYNHKDTAVNRLEIEGDGTAQASFGVGPAFGVMVGGIIPAQVKGTVGVDAKANVNGKITLESNKSPVVEGDAEANLKLLLKGAFDVRIAAKKKDRTHELYKHNDADFTLLEFNKSTRSTKGIVYESDFDDISDNNRTIEGAKVTFKRKNGAVGSKETTTGADGKFKVSNLSEGDYELKIEKDGYLTYLDKDFTEDKVKDISQLKIYLDKDGTRATLKGKIYELDTDNDASNNRPLDLALVELKKVHSSTVSDNSFTTDADGAYEFKDLLPGLYKMKISKVGYKPIDCEIVVHEGDTTIQNYRLEVAPRDLAGNGYATGHVYDALSGRPIEGGLKLSVVQGYNATNGSVIKTVDLANDGSYKLYLPAGGYTVLVKDPRTGDDKKYYSGQFNIKVLGSKTIINQNGTVTPILSGDEVRIVLQWGATPRDLDSHLNGPTPDGKRFHTYYSNKRYEYSTSDNSVKYADLDVDDTSSYGPETTTIYKRVGGKYKFSVHDYTNRGRSESMALADSGAYVTIYKADFAEPKVFNVPYEAGTVWDVFEYDSETDTIRLLDNMYYESEPIKVGVDRTEAAELDLMSIDDESYYKD